MPTLNTASWEFGAIAAGQVVAAAPASQGFKLVGVDQFPGFGQAPTTVREDVVANGPVSASIPGPPAGFVRLVAPITLTATGGVAPAIGVTVQPINRSLGRAIAPASGGSTVPLASMAFYSALPLAAGDHVDFSNTGGPAVLVYSYLDVPAAGLTVVSVQLSNATPVEVIPAAPAGSVRRWVFGLCGWFATPQLHPSVVIFNDDTAAVRVSYFQGGQLIGRSGSAAAGQSCVAFSTAPGFFDLNVESGAFELALAGAVASRPVNVFGCYETIA